MTINLRDLIENPGELSNVNVIKTDYDFFSKSIAFISKKIGKKAKCFFYKKSAYIIFYEKPDILVIVNKEKFEKSDFCFENIEFEIQGKSSYNILTWKQQLKFDIKNYKIAIVSLLILYVLIFCSSMNSNSLNNLNDTFIDIISIFIGTLFVFATLFYEKDEMDNAIESNDAQESIDTDKYIFSIAMISLIMVIVSNGIINYQASNEWIIMIKDIVKQKFYWIYFFVKYTLARILTGSSIVLNYICFKSIIDYYLNKIESKAINRFIKKMKEYIKSVK